MPSLKKNRRLALLETLESRRLLSTSIWTGAAGDHLFSDPNNWQGDVAPSSGDDLQFNDLGTAQTVDVNSAATVGNIDVAGNYTITDQPLTLLGDVFASAGSNVTFSDTIAVTTNSHFTVDTNGTLTLGTLNDSSSDTLDKYDSGDLILAGDSHSTWNLLDNGTITLAANTHIDLFQYGGTLNGSGTLDSISTENVQNSAISPSNSSGPTTLTSLTNTYVNGGSIDIALDGNSNYSQIVNQSNGVALINSPTLNVTLANGYVPATGTTFDIINSMGGPVSGTFNGLAEGATFTVGSEIFSISYIGGGGNEVTLTAMGTTSSATPSVSLVSSTASQTAGQAVTFTATVSGNVGTPTGTVTFSQGSTVLGTAAVNSSGVASFTTSSLAVGTDSITASYGGNSAYTTASSSAVAVSITGTIATEGPTITTPATAAVSTAKAATLSVVATDTSTALAKGLTYTWSIVIMPSGAKTPKFSANGTHAASTVTASFSKDGTYHFRVTVTDANGRSVTSDVDYIVHQKARGMRVTPHGATVKNGATVQYTATALDQFDHAMRVNSSPVYTLAQGSGSVTTSGLFTAGTEAGKFDLDVLLDGIEASIAGKVI